MTDVITLMCAIWGGTCLAKDEPDILGAVASIGAAWLYLTYFAV